jgi:cytochrome c oxidase subunit 4
LSDHAYPAEQHHSVEHAHPSAGQYIRIAIILAVITAIEVAVYYVEQIANLLPWILVGLSALKFGIVAAYYMHLKFDHKLFTGFFVGGLLLAGSVVLGLMTLLGVWTHIPFIQH